jgi:hypothetical protein
VAPRAESAPSRGSPVAGLRVRPGYHRSAPTARVAYPSLRVEEGTKKKAEEFPYGEVIVVAQFAILQKYQRFWLDAWNMLALAWEINLF